MGEGILGNMWVCMGPSILEHSVGLKIAGTGATEWQAPESKIYVIGKIRGINNGDVGIL